jgi:hypothetical protein
VTRVTDRDLTESIKWQRNEIPRAAWEEHCAVFAAAMSITLENSSIGDGLSIGVAVIVFQRLARRSCVRTKVWA